MSSQRTRPHRFVLGLIVAVSLLLSACSSNASYMKASIDGKKWDLTNEPEPIKFLAEFNEIEHELSIEGWSYNPQYISGILIRIENPRKGNFQLDKDSYNHAKIWVVDGNAKKVYHTNNEGCSGKVVIIEFTNTFVKGRFSFTARNENGKLLEVTKGRFSIPLDLLDF